MVALGIFLIIVGIWLMANAYGNTIFAVMGIAAIIGGGLICSTYSKKGKGTVGGTGSSDSGYDGSTHTGTGTPDYVRRSNGTTVDTHGYGWQERVGGGRENVFTGERVENDFYNQPSYYDSDGDKDDNATFY